MGYRGRSEEMVTLNISMYEETKWKVSLLKHTKWFEHQSMLFEAVTTNDKFTVELLVDNGVGEVEFRCRNFDPSHSSYRHLQKENLGLINHSAQDIITSAKSVLKHLGNYHELCSNCQVRIQTDNACLRPVYLKCVEQVQYRA